MEQVLILKDLCDIFNAWPMSDPAPVSQYRSSGPGGYGTSMKPPTHYPSDDYLLPYEPPNNTQHRHVDPVSAVAATAVSDLEAPPLNFHQGYPEGSGLTSSPPQSGHPLTVVRHFPVKAQAHMHHRLPPNFDPTTSIFPTSRRPRSHLVTPEFKVNTDTPCGLAPLQRDHSSTPTGDISWMIHTNEFGDFSASTIAYGSTRDKRTPLGTRSTYSTSSDQTPVFTHSVTNCPSHNRGSSGLFSGYGYGSAPPNFRSANQRRHRTVAVPPIAPSQVSAPRRSPKKYWCEVCGVGFTQRQGLQRHRKDVHGPRRLCPRCKDFEWSPGRKYTLTKHFEAMHPGVALPEVL